MTRCPACNTLLSLDGYCVVCEPRNVRCQRHDAQPGQPCTSDWFGCDSRRYNARKEFEVRLARRVA